MSIKSSVEQLADPIGFDIGHSSTDVQAALLNGLARATSTVNAFDRRVQYTYVIEDLTHEACAMIRELAESLAGH